MKVSQLARADMVAQLRGPGLYLRTGPFVYNLRTRIASVVEGIGVLYGDFPLADGSDFADFYVTLARTINWRPCFHPKVTARVDGVSPGTPVPLEHAFAVFEGCLNWCVYSYAHQYFIIHAAALERNGRAVILPAPPGAGKSTLCAALVNRGWRLLTDELTLINPQTRAIVPLARPISLKNESIEVVRQFSPDAVFGPICPNTIKGTISHLRPPTESVSRVDEYCPAAWLVVPRYRAAAATAARPLPKGQAFMRVAASSVNYMTLGYEGFRIVSDIIDAVDCYEFEYGGLDEAASWFDQL